MKNKIFLLIILFSVIFLSSFSFAQLTGTIDIPSINYPTIAVAIDSLNLQGVGTGGVTFNVAAGHTETFTSDTVGRVTATGTTSNTIIFQKSGTGANPVITAGVGTGTLDGIIVIAGGDYITFDGIDLQENSGNTSATTQMEWGYALLKKNATAPVDGCYFVTIKNSTITLNKANTSTYGIYAANHTPTSSSGLTLSDTLDVMSYCKFNFNTIINSYNGIRIVSSSSSSYYGQNNEVGVDGGNNISNYGGGSSTTYGIYIEYQNNLKVAENTVNGGGSTQSGIVYGIRTGTGNNSNVDIYRNTVTLIQGGTNLIYGISNSTGSSGVDNTVNIYNNTVENCSHIGSTTNSIWLIYNLASCRDLNIYGNKVRNNTKEAGTGTLHCIYNSAASQNAQIYDNEIYNNSSAGPIYGIHIASGTNTSIFRNKIYDLRTTSSSSITSGILAASGPISVYIYNNFISDLKAPNSSATDAIRGINITSTTANSNIGLYYNTIFLNANSTSTPFGTTGIYHTNSTTATTAALDMRNNIIVNMSSSVGTGKTVTLRRSAVNANLNNYSTLSNNNCFYAGTPGTSNVIFFDGTNFDQNIEDFKTRVTPRETNSITENVPFFNSLTPPYNLHVRTDTLTQTESGGIPVTTPILITTDFDGDTRNTTTPDIGADEFTGTGGDFTPPSISYTLFGHTTSTSSRTLSNVTITDQGGVNVTPGTAPRIYFKRSSDNNTYVDNTSSTNGWKYTETSNTSSPFEFLINYSLLFGGTGVQNGDSIQYFVVAQDLASTPNVGIFDGTFTSTPASVNLTSSAFPITGSINFYRILKFLSGIVTVGTGGNYPSITGSYGLFSEINENIVSGNLVAQIISDVDESGTFALNQWVEDVVDANYTLTIQPNSAIIRTVSGSFVGGLININGADRVTFDGRYNGSGHFLTFENTSTASNTATIRLISLGAGQGCSDITIRNCNIKAGTNASSNVFGIFAGSSTGTITTGNAGGADFDVISILDNNIWNCRAGIFARGTSSDQMTDFIVSGNVIGSDNVAESVTEYGMYLGYVDAPQVTYNEVYNMYYDVSKWGIYFTQNTNNAIVSKNKIHSIKQPGTSGYNSVGIYFYSATGCFDNQIDNNMIYDLSTYGSTSMYLVGIRIAGGSNYKVYFNSVSINDVIGNTAANLVSSCLYISAAASNIDVRNNIFLNTRTGSNNPKNYTVHSAGATTFQYIDNNNYWSTGNVFGYFGSDIATFNDWKTATGQDAKSLNIDPMFTSSTDLHINSGLTPTALESGGVFITGFNTDIDDDVRPGPAGSVNGGAIAPDIGADEFDGVPPFAPIQVTVPILSGWNMISNPVIRETGTDSVKQLYPTSLNNYVFAYLPGTGYAQRLVMENGSGYWGKFPDAATSDIIGAPITLDSIDVVNGWNMVGSISYAIDTSTITSVPAGIRSSFWYGYNNGYSPASQIIPGKAYWVKANATGKFVFASGSGLSKNTIQTSELEQYNILTITDNAGNSQTLYFGADNHGQTAVEMYEMPPLPPSGIFDARFEGTDGGYMLQKHSSEIGKPVEFPISVQSSNFPITITWKINSDRYSYELNDGLEGKSFGVQTIAEEGKMTITNTDISRLVLLAKSGDGLPVEFALMQNYPNPFNPVTNIKFALPELSKVAVEIYNILGQKVQTLIKEERSAGCHIVEWNGMNDFSKFAGSGVYYVKISADGSSGKNFTKIRKMILLR